MSRTGIAMVISAPSGAGKTTLINLLQKDFPTLSYSVSCTTRAPRDGEIDGVSYSFIDTETFKKRIESGYFAEWAQVHNNFYGTPLEIVQKRRKEGKDILFDIDIQGAMQLKKTLPDAFFVFILPPSLRVLQKRLQARGTDSIETQAIRLQNAKKEIAYAHFYDALIINDDLAQAHNDLVCAYRAAQLNPRHFAHFLESFAKEEEPKEEESTDGRTHSRS